MGTSPMRGTSMTGTPRFVVGGGAYYCGFLWNLNSRWNNGSCSVAVA